jgi:hypothetical protein
MLIRLTLKFIGLLSDQKSTTENKQEVQGAKKGVFDFSTSIAEILLNPYNMNMQSPRRVLNM